MKRRIIEQTWPDGTRGFIIQKKKLFGWSSLNEFMVDGMIIKVYDTLEEAREAILNKPGTYDTKVVYTEK